MACFIDEEITLENVKKSLIAGGASENEAEHDAKTVIDFINYSRERNGEYDRDEIPPGYAIIEAAKKEKAGDGYMAQPNIELLTEEEWAAIAAGIEDRAAARRKREAAVILDPEKEFTG